MALAGSAAGNPAGRTVRAGSTAGNPAGRMALAGGAAGNPAGRTVRAGGAAGNSAGRTVRAGSAAGDSRGRTVRAGTAVGEQVGGWGIGATAEQQGEVGPGAQQIHSADRAHLLPRPGDPAEPSVGGQHLGCGQVIAGQRGGADRVGPAVHPRVPDGFFALLTGGVGVDGQDRGGHRAPQLAGSHTGCVRQHRRLDRGGMRGGQAAGPVGEDLCLRQVDPTGFQRGSGRPQHSGQFQRQPRLGLGGDPGQGQRGGDLIGNELTQLAREAAGRGGRCAVFRAAASQLGHSGQLPRRRPRRQPPPGCDQPDQLVVGDLGQRVVAVLGEPGQRQSRGQRIKRPAVSEPAPATRAIPRQPSGRVCLGPAARLKRPVRLTRPAAVV